MCPMSSASISEAGKEVLVAAETHGRVFFIRVDRDSGQVSDPISPEKPAKYPVALANERGDTLFVWAEGAGWNRGGSVAYEVFNESGTTLEKSRVDGLPAWSLPTAFVERSGNFTVVY